MATKTYDKKDYHHELTEKLIALMEESKETGWTKPWFSCNELPFNPVTGTRYKGVNVVSLLTSGFDDPRFFTFNNVRELSQQDEKAYFVKAGSKGTPVFKAVQVVVGAGGAGSGGENEDNDQVEQTHGGVRTYWKQVYAGTVFNGSQIEGLEPYVKRENLVEDMSDIETLSEALQARTKLQVTHSSEGRAYYSSHKHLVHMPNKDLFKSTQDYYSTLMHELTHASGPELGRKLGNAFGSKEYAFEELVAELGSYFLGAELGLPYNASGHEQHAAYLNNWLDMLKNDKTIIFKAAGHSSKATEFNMNHFRTHKLELGFEQEVNQEPLKVIEKSKGLAVSM